MRSNSRSRSPRDGRESKGSMSRSPQSKSRSPQNNSRDNRRRERRDHRSYSSSRSRNRSRNKSKDRSVSNENQGSVLYVTNLSSRIKERHIEEKFGKYGSIQSVKIVKDPYTKESRGFCFIYFNNAKDADDALDNLNGYDFEGRRIRVEKAKRNKPRDQTPGRYLGNYKSRNGGSSRRSNSSYRRERSRSPRKHSRSKSQSRSRSRRRRYSRYRSRS